MNLICLNTHITEAKLLSYLMKPVVRHSHSLSFWGAHFSSWKQVFWQIVATSGQGSEDRAQSHTVIWFHQVDFGYAEFRLPGLPHGKASFPFTCCVLPPKLFRLSVLKEIVFFFRSFPEQVLTKSLL